MTKCACCITEINFDEDGGHIYPDGSVLCPSCEGKTLEEILKEHV